ncbi:MAG: hypothetical protein IMZ53_12765 [Thermoplasmata archaeon]|nr:hypothetical protein [Thermoplasmata archaeon]
MKFTVTLDELVSKEEVNAFIKYRLGVIGEIAIVNPLSDLDLEADCHSVTIKEVS